MYRPIILLVLLFYALTTVAQQPPGACPGGQVTLTSLCSQACVLCEDINNFTGNNSITELGEAPAGFCAPQLHNTQWLGFIANSPSLSLTVDVFNCNTGDGLQIGIYNTLDCTSFSLVSNCESSVPAGTSATFNTTAPLEIGGIYFLVVDGSFGDICDFNINVTNGSTGAPDITGQSASIFGPPTICPGGTASIGAQLTGASIYEWTIDGAPVPGFESTLDFSNNVPGTYNLCVTPSNPCYDGVQSCTQITVAPLPPLFQDETICEGEFFPLGGQVFNTTGVYTVPTVTAEGCDQDIILNLNVVPPIVTNLVEVVCPFEVVQVAGEIFSQSGFYTRVLTSFQGCDSTINLDLTVLPFNFQVLEEEICQGESVTVGSNVYTQSGFYENTFTSFYGCDSTVALFLTVYEPMNIVIDTVICEGEFVDIGFSSYSDPGFYNQTEIGPGGCLNTVNLTLDVSAPETDVSATICQGDSYSLGGTNYTTSGQYSAVLTSTLGCDSTVNLTLNVENAISETIQASICQGESYTFGSNTYFNGGTYQESFTSSTGCDSTVTLNLTVSNIPPTTLNETICNGESYTVGNSTYSNSGTFQDILIGAGGCDSTVNLTLNVIPEIITNLNANICDGDSYTVGTSNYSQSGTYTDILTAASGCDSTVNLTLVVDLIPQTTLMAEICDGETYQVGNSVYAATGNYTDILIGPNGCDSVILLDLVVLNIPPTDVAVSICNGQSYTFGNTTYTTAGNYQATFSSIDGCDSLVNLTLTVENILEESLSTSICEGESYTVGNSVYTQAGQYSDSFVTAEGCDSIFYLDLNIIEPVETNLNETICDGEVFMVGNDSYSNAGTYQNTLIANSGCDSIVNLVLNVLQNPETALTETICPGESVLVGNTTYSNAGSYQEVLVANNGCDSIVNLELIVLNAPQTNLVETICDGEEFIVGNSTYTTSGSFQDFFQTTQNCDSVVFLELTVLEAPVVDLVEQICEGESYTVANNTYTTSGIYQEIIPAANGCDSTINLDLTVSEVPVIDIVQTICVGASVTVGTSTYSTTGSYQDILVTTSGCDSIVNLDLTVANSYEINLVAQICEGQTYSFGGNILSVSGNYQEQFIATDGCDSIVNLDLTIQSNSSMTLTETICNGEVFMVGNSEYSSSGTYQDVLLSSTGCDSTVTLNLTINDLIETNLIEAICDGEAITVGSSTYTATGTYQDLLVASDGCDSLVSLDLTVFPILQTDLQEELCAGESITIGTTVYNTTGTYQEILTSTDNCDSIVNLVLTVAPPIETNLVETLCNGSTYTVGNSTYTSSGQYQDVLLAADGCDSTVYLDLIIDPAIETNLVESICDGESYLIGNSEYTTSGQYQDILLANSGCDSTVFLTLTIISDITTTLTETICDGEAFTVGQETFTTSGLFSTTLTASTGCDSIVELDLTVLEILETNLIETICDGASIEVGTSSYSTTGVYQDILTASTGCDSIVTLDLAVLQNTVTALDEIICDGESYTVGNSVYTQSGAFQDILPASNGCDSIINLDLIVNPTFEANLVESICEGSSYAINTIEYTASGQYQEVLSAVSGCDSTVTLDLTVIPIETTTLVEAICDGETYLVGNTSYNSTGQFTTVLTASTGCDSIVELDLLVNEIPETNLVEAICDGNSFTVGNSTYSTTGIYQDILVAASGCDSIVSLDLTVQAILETNLVEEICDGESYIVGNSVYTQSGSFQDNLIASTGCDSIVSLELTVHPIPETNLTEAICDGESYTVGTTEFSNTGQYQEILLSSTNCDSIVNLDLTVIPIEITSLVEEICDGETYIVGSSTYSTTGQFSTTLIASTGCDSIVELDLFVIEIQETNLVESICEGTSFTVGTSTYSNAGTYQDILLASTGCDSIVNLDLSVVAILETNLTEAICEGESYSVGNSVYNTSGTYQENLIAESGCDSIVYLDLIVNEVYETNLVESICDGDSYTIGTNSFSASGSFTEILTSAEGCDSTVNLLLTVFPCQLELVLATTDTDCHDASDGSISLALTVGTPPYTYSWAGLNNDLSGDGAIESNNLEQFIENLPAGTYEFTIIDSNDITMTTQAIVEQPQALVLGLAPFSYGNYNTSCDDTDDGIIEALISGGTPPYSFLWSTGETTSTIEGLAAGDYSLTIIDSNGCPSESATTLTAPPAVAVAASTTDPLCFGDLQGSIIVDSVSGGTEPYLFSIDDKPFGFLNIFPNLGIGTYMVRVQDSNGCTWEESMRVNEPEELIVDLGEDLQINLGDSIQLLALTTEPVSEVAWNAGSALSCEDCLDPFVTPMLTTSYSIRVQNEDGCVDTDDITIIVSKERNIYIPNAFSPNLDGVNEVFMINAGSGVAIIKSFMVFNRWGETMFELYNFQPNDPVYGWDGTHRNEVLNSGVYVYYAEVEFVDGEVVQYKGDVALIK